MKIGVIGGTTADTKMGVDFILSKNHDAIGRACSKNPKEQTDLQILHKSKLTNLFIKLGKELISEGAEGIFVNCNSLSSAIDLCYARSNLSVKAIL